FFRRKLWLGCRLLLNERGISRSLHNPGQPLTWRAPFAIVQSDQESALLAHSRWKAALRRLAFRTDPRFRTAQAWSASSFSAGSGRRFTGIAGCGSGNYSRLVRV